MISEEKLALAPVKVSVVFVLVAVVFWLIVKTVELLMAVTVVPAGIPVPDTAIPTASEVVLSIVMCFTLVVDPSLRPLVWLVSQVESAKPMACTFQDALAMPYRSNLLA